MTTQTSFVFVPELLAKDKKVSVLHIYDLGRWVLTKVPYNTALENTTLDFIHLEKASIR